jgi:uncharacterized membrane protein
VGENWKQFDPVGACAKRVVLLYSRIIKMIPRMMRTIYVMILAFAFGGAALLSLRERSNC